MLIPTMREARRSARSVSASSWTFDQDIHSEFERLVLERLASSIRKRGHDQQDAVGTPGTCLVD